MNTTTWLWAPILTCCVLISAFLVVTGHLTDGPQLVDDNQIFRLQIEFEEDGFFQVLVSELAFAFERNRFVPLFSIQKIVQAKIFGGSLFAWSVWMGLLGALTAGMLFYFARLCRGSLLACSAFVAIVVIGEQSVVWWRMLHGEGIGMLMLSIALVSMMKEIRTQKSRYEIVFALFMTLSAFSKESFVVAIPAVLFLKIWITARERKVTLLEATKRSWRSVVWLTLVFATELAIVKWVFATTSFKYTGYKGFDAGQLQAMVLQYLQITNVLLAAGLILLALLLFRFGGKSKDPDSSDLGPDSEPKPSPDASDRQHNQRQSNRGQANRRQRKDRNAGKKTVPSRETGSQQTLTQQAWTQQPWVSLVMAVVFCLLMTLPQLLLYMSSGMLNENEIHYGRYIYPAIVGYAFLVFETIRLIQCTSRHGRVIAGLVGVMLAVSIVDKSGTAYREAVHWAKESRTTDHFFEAVVNNTDPDSPIVVAFINGKAQFFPLRKLLRMYHLLAGSYQRENLYFFPVPTKPKLAEVQLDLFYPELARHAPRLRPIEKMDASRPPAAVLIFNLGPPSDKNLRNMSALDQWLKKQRFEWFEPQAYRRKTHDHGHITYLHKQK